MRLKVNFLVWMVMPVFLLSGCACPSKNSEELALYEQNDDPLEPMNRGIFAFNMAMDKMLLKPVAQGYRYVVPKPVRTGASNVFSNLKQPVYLFNALLQGEGETSWNIIKRFSANTFWGFFGVFDVASEIGIPKADNDFGQTLAVWGWEKSSPYLMLPVLGPSTPRDAVGTGVDLMVAPVDWALRPRPVLLYTKVAYENWSKRESALDFMDNLEKSSIDFYATVRSMYQQNRRQKIDDSLKKSGQVGDEPQKADYEFDFDIEEE